jgi:hypothetical protein
MDWQADAYGPKVRFTGSDQTLGQLQESNPRDFQSTCWANLRVRANPVSLRLRFALARAESHDGGRRRRLHGRRRASACRRRDRTFCEAPCHTRRSAQVAAASLVDGGDAQICTRARASIIVMRD